MFAKALINNTAITITITVTITITITITITLNDIVILTSTRSSATGGLWTLDPLPASSYPIPHSIKAAINGYINAIFHLP
jgi:hypothetical protein